MITNPNSRKQSTELEPNFRGGFINNDYIKAGVFVRQTLAQRNIIDREYLLLDSETSTLVLVVGGAANELYKLISLPASGGTQNSDWEQIPLGSTSALTPVGEFDAATGFIVPTANLLLDTAAVGNEGDYYVVTNAPSGVTNTFTGLFRDIEVTVYTGDTVLSVGAYFALVRPTTTWETLNKPAVIEDYVNGTVISHTHPQSEVTDLVTDLAAKYDVSFQASKVTDYDTLDNAKLLDIEFAKQYYHRKWVSGGDGTVSSYSKSETDAAIAASGGGGGGTPGGADTYVQFNAAGSFSGVADFAWVDGSKLLRVGAITGDNVTLNGGLINVYEDQNPTSNPVATVGWGGNTDEDVGYITLLSNQQVALGVHLSPEGDVANANYIVPGVSLGIGTKTPDAETIADIVGTSSVGIPVGTTGERPSTPKKGMFRYNDTLALAEIWNGSGWSSFQGSPGGADTQLQYNNAGAFGGSVNMVFDGNTVTLKNSIAGPSTPALALELDEATATGTWTIASYSRSNAAGANGIGIRTIYNLDGSAGATVQAAAHNVSLADATGGAEYAKYQVTGIVNSVEENLISIDSTNDREAYGVQSSVAADGGVALGPDALVGASGDNGVAIGFGAQATQTSALARGFGAIANGIYGIADGDNTLAQGSGSHAHGRNMEVTGNYSVQFGYATGATTLSAASTFRYYPNGIQSFLFDVNGLSLGDGTGAAVAKSIQVLGTGNANLTVSPAGTGTIKTPSGYDANVSANEDVINKKYADDNYGVANAWGTLVETTLNYPQVPSLSDFTAVDGITNQIDLSLQDGTETYDFITNDVGIAGRSSSGDVNHLRFLSGGALTFKTDQLGDTYTSGSMTVGGSFLQSSLTGSAGFSFTRVSNYTGADSAWAMQGTITETAANRQNFLKFVPTVNHSASAVGYTALLVDVTETAAIGTDDYLVDLQVGSVSRFSLGSKGVAQINHVHSSQNATTTALLIQKSSSGGIGQNGLGSTVRFEAETDSEGVFQVTGDIQSSWGDVVNEYGVMGFQVYNAGTNAIFLRSQHFGVTGLQTRLSGGDGTVNLLILNTGYDFALGTSGGLRSTIDSSSPNVALDTWTHTRNTSGTAGVGIGAGTKYRIEDAGGALIDSGFYSYLDNVSASNENSVFHMNGSVAGTASQDLVWFNLGAKKGLTLGSDSDQTILTATVTLSQSEIQNISTTPITAIVATGAGTYAQIQGASAYLDHNGTDYTGGSGLLRIKYSGGSNLMSCGATFVTATSDTTRHFNPPDGDVAILHNTAVVLQGDADFSGNGGDIEVAIQYVIKTVT